MKYLAILGSPRKEGNTAALLSSFLEGAASKGCSGNTLFLQAKQIAPCTSCNGCKKDGTGVGQCVFADDMNGLYPLVEKADVLIYAIPVYWWSIPAHTKAFMDRLYALDYSVFKGKKLCLLMTFQGEEPNSGPVLIEKTFRDICEWLGVDFSGCLAVCSGTTPVGENRDALEKAFRLGASIL